MTYRAVQPVRPRKLLSCGFVLLIMGIPFAAVHATPLDEYQAVCPNEEIDVDWTGPDRPGDRIMISNPDDPPGVEENWDFAETSEGNPVTLTAPNAPGSYEKRYVQDEPLETLDKGDLEVVDCSCSVEHYPTETHAVLVHALQSSSGEQVIEHGPITIEQLCSAASAVVPVVRDIIGRAEVPLGVPSSVIDAHVNAQLNNAREAVCSIGDATGETVWSTFVYSHCRLAAQSGPYSMDIHLPPGTGNGTMSMANHPERQIMRMTLKRTLEQARVGTGSGWSSGINMEFRGEGPYLGYPTNIYDFEYKMGLGIGSFGEMTQDQMGQIASPQMLGNLVSVTVSGTGQLAQCIPGGNILTAYHEKLTRELQPNDGSMGAFAGLVKNQVGMLEYGVPLDMTSKTTGKIAGIPMVRGTDRNRVTGFEVVEMPADWCTRSLMPDDYEVIDIDQQVNQMTGAGASAPGASQQEMQQLNEAMKQLEGLGLENLIPGMAANPAGQAPAPSSMPSSDSLMSDNITQSVQRHLQALGYEPGNTDGELSTDTMIAISQFQAEKGRKVTGEVTPQLLGVLAALVDSQ